MSITRRIHRPVIACMLACGLLASTADAKPSQTRAHITARGFAGAQAPAGDTGNPNAVPPILPVMTSAELRAMRRDEAAQARRSAYRLPAASRYSDVEMMAFALEGISLLEAPRWHWRDAAAHGA